MNTTMGAPQRRFPWVWMGHREYDPLACRFLTRDPIGYDGGINLYAYCGNNPIMFADPSGLDVVIFVHGTILIGKCDPVKYWDKSFCNLAAKDLLCAHQKFFGWEGNANKNGIEGTPAENFLDYVESTQIEYPNEKIIGILSKNRGEVLCP